MGVVPSSTGGSTSVVKLSTAMAAKKELALSEEGTRQGNSVTTTSELGKVMVDTTEDTREELVPLVPRVDMVKDTLVTPTGRVVVVPHLAKRRAHGGGTAAASARLEDALVVTLATT